MIFGEYKHQLDEKNRLRLPVKLKQKLGERYVILKGSNRSLFVFSQSELETTMLEKLKSLPLLDAKAQKTVRAMFSSGFEVEEDNQGRFVLPPALKEFAGIKKNVVSIGAGNRVEIWAEEQWNDYNSNEDYDSILEELGDYGI